MLNFSGKLMIMFGLTELGHIVKLDVEEKNKTHSKIIENAIVLDTEHSTFTIDYSTNYGALITDTITDNPKEIYDRLAKARREIENRELSLMKNLFIIDKNSYSVEDLSKQKRKPRKKKEEQ